MRDFAFPSLRSRLIAYMFTLVLLVEAITFSVIFKETAENVRTKIQSDLVSGAHLFYKQVNRDFEVLLKAAASVSASGGGTQALLRGPSPDEGALAALGHRTGANLVVVADLTRRKVFSDHGNAREQLYEIESAIRRSRPRSVTGFLIRGDRMYQVAYARIGRTRTERWLGLGHELSRGSPVSVDGITRLRVSFLSFLPGIKRSLIATHLPPAVKDELETALLSWKEDTIKFIDIGSVDQLTLAVPLRMLIDHRVFSVFHYSMDQAIQPLQTFQRVLLLILAAGVLLCCAVALRLAWFFLRPLRALTAGTDAFREGNLGHRIADLGPDEFGELARSFNAMGDRIQELIALTERRARMESELKMARMVQERLIPAKGFSDPNFTLAGKLFPATECAGDWWYHHQVGRNLIVAICDVAGHGASAALMTAAVHSCLSLLVSQLDPRALVQEADLDRILRLLNLAAHSAAGQESPITFFLCSIDLDTGAVVFTNAAHCQPLIVRGEEMIPLAGARAPLLGYAAELQPYVHRFELTPGDLILWYSDGLFDSAQVKREDQYELRRRALRRLVELSNRGGSRASTICAAFGDELQRGLAETGKAQYDDITFIVGFVAGTSAWGKKNRAA